MLKNLKIFIFLFTIIFTSNVNAKPIPPGAGDGDVAANILFLVDSSASMGRWIGSDGLGRVRGVSYDSDGNILIGQNARRAAGAVLRYTSAGARDTSFTPIRRIPRAGCAQHIDATRGINNQRFRRASTVKFVDNAINNEGIIFIVSQERRLRNYVFGFSENGRNCRFAISGSRGGQMFDIDVKNIGGTNYLFMAGQRNRNRGYFKVTNLTTMQSTYTEFNNRNHITRRYHRFSVNNDASRIYFSDAANGGALVGHALNATAPSYTLGGEVIRCNAVNNPNLTNQLMYTTAVGVSPDDSNIIYTSSHVNHALQRIDVSSGDCAVTTSIGRGVPSGQKNTGDAGSLSANDVNFNQVWAIHVTSTSILTGTQSGYVDELNEFTAGNRDAAWQQTMGGPRVRRWDGVKQALNAIVNDTTLTTGAHFGFGHWNAGERPGRNAPRGGAYCHRNPDCRYYGGWNGEHPNGTSTICYSDACLNVGISARGAGQIMDVFNPLGMAWGTDSHAFSQIAEDYFNDTNAGGSLLDPDSECQINYVIVIGDGAMNNTGVLGQGGQTAARMARLREMGVKSIYVAYGGGIQGTNLQRFHELTRIGTSEAGNADACANDDECERAIVALTPEDLKTSLTARIRQIIADRLAFTAPSITATIQEGGSLYQAQFAYEQFGEWQGTILRKRLNSNGEVDHNTDPGNAFGNWSAATVLRGQSTAGGAEDDRRIWSALSGIPYLGNWDNFNADNSDAINILFDTLGYTVQDYYRPASVICTEIHQDAILGDERIGIINFIKGNDYFDYDGDCNVTEVRRHVMGDIYHSQIVEVGAPDANVRFKGTNEEAYYRATNGYQNFASANANRTNVLYAGSNSGILHAINSETGREEWGFIPPFVGAILPQVINDELQGKVDGDNGGTNPIFGVDGSPVVHDVFIRGFNSAGELETSKSWRTLLFIPYGRGGAGFSVLDVTKPIVNGNDGPIHMFSIYNDKINERIYRADQDGEITQFEYNSSSSSLLDTSEGEVATDNYNEARDADEEEGDDVTTRQDTIAPCQSTTDFKDNGTNSCYVGSSFHYPNLELDFAVGETIPAGLLNAVQLVNNVPQPVAISGAEMVDDGGGGAILKVTFPENKVYNANPSTQESRVPDQVTISACHGASGIPAEYDYTKLGESWSVPRIIRIPTSQGGQLNDDKYVAILGAGMSKSDRCGGSAIFLVDLEGQADDQPGRLFAADVNGGPITIVDTSPTGLSFGSAIEETPNGSDIKNAIPATPVVVTPDTAPDIPWRGALVYVNDLEGKITKINLSNNTKGYNASGDLVSGTTKLFDQTTLFRLNASEENGRYSYFGMDAGLGIDDGLFYLFGSTGNFTDLGSREQTLDNIIYGLRDPHYPYWKHLNGVVIPRPIVDPNAVPIQVNPEFYRLAHKGANNAARHIGNSIICTNVSGDGTGINCPLPAGADSWVAHMEKDGSGLYTAPRTFRKASARPTLFKGTVYYPVYQPPPGNQRCSVGHAFICGRVMECGQNVSERLALETPEGVINTDTNNCAYVREGVLSELVMFADKLYANVAGPSDDEDTLFSILSIPGDIITNKGGWRDSSF